MGQLRDGERIDQIEKELDRLHLAGVFAVGPQQRAPAHDPTRGDFHRPDLFPGGVNQRYFARSASGIRERAGPGGALSVSSRWSLLERLQDDGSFEKSFFCTIFGGLRSSGLHRRGLRPVSRLSHRSLAIHAGRRSHLRSGSIGRWRRFGRCHRIQIRSRRNDRLTRSSDRVGALVCRWCGVAVIGPGFADGLMHVTYIDGRLVVDDAATGEER